MFSLNDSMRFYLFSEPTDMRKSFFTLSGIVQNKMGRDLVNGDVYIFINRDRNRIKLLHMEPGGLVIYSKILDIGRLNFPKGADLAQVVCSIEWSDLVCMVEGIVENPGQRLRRLRALKPLVQPSLFLEEKRP